MPAVTNKVPGNGTNTLSYAIPGAGLDVEAVRVVIDASGAGGPVTAEVTITDQSGVVIASKPQAETVDQGVTGSATWALRLEDGGGGGGTDPHAVHYDVSGETGGFIDATTLTDSVSFYDRSGNGIYLTSKVGGLASGGFIGLQTGDGTIGLESSEIANKLRPGGGNFTVQDHTGAVILFIREDADVLLAIGAGNNLTIPGLPTVNPGGSNRLWNNGGVLNIT